MPLYIMTETIGKLSCFPYFQGCGIISFVCFFPPITHHVQVDFRVRAMWSSFNYTDYNIAVQSGRYLICNFKENQPYY